MIIENNLVMHKIGAEMICLLSINMICSDPVRMIDPPPNLTRNKSTAYILKGIAGNEVIAWIGFLNHAGTAAVQIPSSFCCNAVRSSRNNAGLAIRHKMFKLNCRAFRVDIAVAQSQSSPCDIAVCSVGNP